MLTLFPRKPFTVIPSFPATFAAWSRPGPTAAGWAALCLAVAVGLPAGLRGASATKVTLDARQIAQAALVTLPAPPAWKAAEKNAAWTAEDIKAEFGRITSSPPRINLTRAKLIRPDHAWLVAFNGWFRGLQKPLKIRFEDQAFDCDDFANTFVAFADLLALRSGQSDGSVCVGWASVNYRVAFAGIRRGTAHAVAIVGTSQGLFIVEPQDGTMVSLREFPNRDSIEDVYF